MYYGQFELDKYLNDTIFKNKRDGFFVEAGAYDGVEESTCKFFEDSLNWTGINFEPVPEIYNLLTKNRPNCFNYSFALSDRVDEKIFTHIVHPERGIYFGNGSLNHNINHLNELKKEGCTLKEYKVYCYPFYYIFHYFYQEIDLFVLDVEGYELVALDGILRLNKKKYPKVFCIEHTLCGFDNLKEKMENNGYLLKDTYKQNSIYMRKE